MICITGASGFVGRRLVAALANDGVALWATARQAGDVAGLPVEPLDLTDPGAYRCLPSGLRAVVHLAAAIPRPQQPDLPDERFAHVNGWGTHLVAAYCREAGVQRLVYTSSMSVYTRRAPQEDAPVLEDEVAPAGLYGLTKWWGETAVALQQRRGGARAISLRLSSVYGPGQADHTVLPRFLHQARLGGPLEVHGEGLRTQDFVHVDDVVQAIRLALENPEVTGPVNVGSGMETSIRDLAEMIARLTPGGRRTSIKHISVPDEDHTRFLMDLARAAEELGYKPSVPLERGLEELWREEAM